MCMRDLVFSKDVFGGARGDWTCSILGTPPELARNWRLRHHLLRTQTSGPTPKVCARPIPPRALATNYSF